MISDNGRLFLRPADAGDMEILFRWANDSLVRKNAFHQEKISKEEHKAWFQNLLQDRNQKQYILMCKDEPVGQIRLVVRCDHAVVNYSIDPGRRGRGYGKEMLRLVTDEVRKNIPSVKVLAGRVKSGNTASENCFTESRFVRTYSQYELRIDRSGDGEK